MTDNIIQIVDLETGTNESRVMTSDEAMNYSKVLEESTIVLNSAKEKLRKKEEAIAKLVLLGLTEDDIRIVMS